ncbi:MAG: SDR family NAD(P)-dependent oxidoreductase, partial [Crenarchaeota archaeon]|nr:SDR family NAD(P)-dependent oxidoreductase [Thermoproteota archaeon]
MERVCILTGGSSGIGKATALALSKTSLFTHYVLIGRNKETVDSVVEKMKENKVEAMFVFGDLSKPESLANTIDIVC